MPDTLARIPAEAAASPVLSLNVKETIEHAGQAKVIVKFAEPLQAGSYKVNWQAVSADTHKVKGSFVFEVRP